MRSATMIWGAKPYADEAEFPERELWRQIDPHGRRAWPDRLARVPDIIHVNVELIDISITRAVVDVAAVRRSKLRSSLA